MEQSNPAVASQTSLSPADLERVGNDPSLLTVTARKMLAVQLMTMHKRMADPNVPVSQRQAWIEFLSKLGDAVPKQIQAVTPGAGFSVQIVFNRPQQEIVDVTAKTREVDSECDQAPRRVASAVGGAAGAEDSRSDAGEGCEGSGQVGSARAVGADARSHE